MPRCCSFCFFPAPLPGADPHPYAPLPKGGRGAVVLQRLRGTSDPDGVRLHAALGQAALRNVGPPGSGSSIVRWVDAGAGLPRFGDDVALGGDGDDDGGDGCGCGRVGGGFLRVLVDPSVIVIVIVTVYHHRRRHGVRASPFILCFGGSSNSLSLSLYLSLFLDGASCSDHPLSWLRGGIPTDAGSPLEVGDASSIWSIGNCSAWSRLTAPHTIPPPILSHRSFLSSYAHLYALKDHLMGTAAVWVPSGGGAKRYDKRDKM